MTGLSSRGCALLASAAALLLLAASGCQERQRGDPVTTHHYQHVITVFPDRSQVRIKTFVNQDHLQVGIHFEDLFDGDRDGKLATPGMDRVQITDYQRVEDPPDAAVRSVGEVGAYDALFQQILEAARNGRESLKIEERRYVIRVLSSNVEPASVNQLTSIP